MTARIRVLIDARALLGRFSGVGRFVTSIVHELVTRDDLQIIALCGRGAANERLVRSGVELLETNFSRRHMRPDRRAWWEETRLRRWVRLARADVLHATWNTGVPPCCPVPALLTIHDLIPLHGGCGFGSRRADLAYRYALTRSARRAAILTTVSRYVRTDVIARLGLRSERVQVVYNGTDLGEADNGLVAPVEGREPYVLYVGGHEPRKEVASLLRAMNAYWQTFGTGLKLRITGRADDLCAPARAAFGELVWPDGVEFVEQVHDGALRDLYAGAVALVLLSSDEGFGLPPLEAMAAGCPVIGSNGGSLPEIIADGGIVLADAHDAAAVSRQIHRVRTDVPWRLELIRKGTARLARRRFAWREAAGAYAELYRRLAGAHPVEPGCAPSDDQATRAGELCTAAAT